MRLENFLCSDLEIFAKYRRIADFNDFPNFGPPVVEKIEESDRRFLAVW